MQSVIEKDGKNQNRDTRASPSARINPPARPSIVFLGLTPEQVDGARTFACQIGPCISCPCTTRQKISRTRPLGRARVKQQTAQGESDIQHSGHQHAALHHGTTEIEMRYESGEQAAMSTVRSSTTRSETRVGHWALQGVQAVAVHPIAIPSGHGACPTRRAGRILRLPASRHSDQSKEGQRAEIRAPKDRISAQTARRPEYDARIS